MNSNNFNDREAFLVSAEAFLKDELYQMAIDLAEERLQRLPGDMDARVILCRALMEKGAFEEAKQILSDIEKNISGVASIYARMGDLYRERGLEEDAVSHYRKCIALNPGSDSAKDLSLQLGQGVYPSDESCTGEGDDSYDDIRDLAADFHTLTTVELYIRQGHLGMAADVLEEIVRKDGANAKAAELLRCVKTKKDNITPGWRTEKIVSELTRWIKNINRIRIHAS